MYIRIEAKPDDKGILWIQYGNQKYPLDQDIQLINKLQHDGWSLVCIVPKMGTIRKRELISSRNGFDMVRHGTGLISQTYYFKKPNERAEQRNEG